MGWNLSQDVWLLKCTCVSGSISVFDGSACTLDTDTPTDWWPFFPLLRCYVSSVDRVVNWPKWILIKSRYPACNVNVLPGHRIILLPHMEQLNWCNGTFVFLEGGQRYFDEPFCTRYRAVNIQILCIQAASISGQSMCICSVCRWPVWYGFPQKWSNRGPRLLLHLQPTACC